MLVKNKNIEMEIMKKTTTLDNILRPVKQAAGKALVKVGLPLVLAFGAANYAQAQIDPVNTGRGDFTVLSETERDIHLNKQVNPYVNHVREDVTYTLDVLRVQTPAGKKFTVLYLGDRDWSKGDKFDASYITHKDFSDKSWTDEEVDFYMNIPGASPVNWKNEDFYDGIITKLNSVERADEE